MKRNRLLLGTLYSLIGLSVASLGVTAAWYQSSTQLRVETFEIGVHSSRDLKISASEDIASFDEHTAGYQYDKDSGNYIKKDDTSLQLKTQDDFLFKPVTSMYSFEEDWTQDEVPFTKEKKTKPVFYDSYIEGNVKKPMSPSIASSGYFSQELYLLADADCYVTLDPYSCFFNGYTSMDEDKPAIQDIATMIHKENLKKAKEIHPYEKRGIDDRNVSEDDYYESWADGMDKLYRSLRISILVPDEEVYQYAILDPFKDGDIYFASNMDLSLDGYYDWYYDGTSKREILYGDIDEDTRGKIVYDTTPGNSTGKDGPIHDQNRYSSFDALTKDDCYHLEMEESLENGLKAAKEHSYALKDQGQAYNELMIPVYRNTPRKIVLSIYLEGWDRECINSTMGGTFLSTLSFMIAKEM